MPYETDFDSAFTTLLGKAVGAITPTLQTPTTTDTTTPTASTPISAGIEYVIDAGSSAISNGAAGGLIAPFSMQTSRLILQEFDGISGSIKVDVRISLPGNSPSFSSIGSATISGGRYATADFTEVIDQFDLIEYVVSGASTIRRVTVALLGRRTDV
jgi:hypothetical protein